MTTAKKTPPPDDTTSTYSVRLKDDGKQRAVLIPRATQRTQCVVVADEDCNLVFSEQLKGGGVPFPLTARVPVAFVVGPGSALTAIRVEDDVTVTVAYWTDGAEVVRDALDRVTAAMLELSAAMRGNK